MMAYHSAKLARLHSKWERANHIKIDIYSNLLVIHIVVSLCCLLLTRLVKMLVSEDLMAILFTLFALSFGRVHFHFYGRYE